MNICMDKKSFRAKAKAVRSSLNTVHYSRCITGLIRNWQLYKEAENVMIFAPINSEISLMELLKDSDKNFYFPAVRGDEILPVKYDSNEGFVKGKYDISEPVGQELNDVSVLDIVFVPALAADKNGYRLGYGKGYYDRFAKRISSKTVTALPVCKKLLYDNIPNEAHDVPVDCIITEEEILSL